MFPSMRFSSIRVFEAVCDPPPLDNGSDTAYIKRFQENRACPATAFGLRYFSRSLRHACLFTNVISEELCC